jgi:hypothetical protein
MLISTAFSPNQEMLATAEELTELFNGEYIERSKHSIANLFLLAKSNGTANSRLIIVERDDLKLYDSAHLEQPFFFHPSMAALRINRLQRVEVDPLVRLSQLKPGERFLDCTLGIGSDTLVAAYAVGKSGEVWAIESDLALSTIVGRAILNGAKLPSSVFQRLAQIKIINGNYNDVLATLSADSADVVYFDPMFKLPIAESCSFEPLRFFANYTPLTEQAISEARRVAKRMIILKAEKGSALFTKFGFQEERRSADFSYGIITK